MATFLLLLIYLAFISLGLPDSLLGTAWPLMQIEFNSPIDAAGLIYMIISGGTIISSLASGYILKRINTNMVVLISCLMTASAMLCFYFSPSYILLLFIAIPLGLGGGSVDAGLNSYVALNYQSYHMNWLHCFWGVGASLGPMIMSFYIKSHNSWRKGYLSVSVIQFALVVIFLVTLPVWTKVEKDRNNKANALKNGEEPDCEIAQLELKILHPIRIKGVIFAMLTFLFYVAAEASMGLWASSFFVNIKDIDAATAAQWVSIYYAGITIGRIISGFVTIKLKNSLVIRLAILISIIGTILIILPLPSVLTLAGSLLIGLGFAPIYPCTIHETPHRFGKENTQKIIGYQMALGYCGSTFLAPFIGTVASNTTIGILPYTILFFIVMCFMCTERINLIMKKRKVKCQERLIDITHQQI